MTYSCIAHCIFSLSLTSTTTNPNKAFFTSINDEYYIDDACVLCVNISIPSFGSRYSLLSFPSDTRLKASSPLSLLNLYKHIHYISAIYDILPENRGLETTVICILILNEYKTQYRKFYFISVINIWWFIRK